MPGIESLLWNWQVNTPQAQASFSNLPVASFYPYVYQNFPVEWITDWAVEATNAGEKEPETAATTQSGGGGTTPSGGGGGDGRETYPGGGVSGWGDRAYIHEPDFWGGTFAPTYTLKDNLLDVARGVGALKYGGLLTNALTGFGGPLTEPSALTGLKQFAGQYGLDYDTLVDQINRAYGNLGYESVLDVLRANAQYPFSDVNWNDIMNNIAYSTDTLRGIVMAQTPQFSFFNELGISPWQAAQAYDALGMIGLDVTNPAYYTNLGVQQLAASLKHPELQGYYSRYTKNPYTGEYMSRAQNVAVNAQVQAANAARRNAFSEYVDNVLAGNIPYTMSFDDYFSAAATGPGAVANTGLGRALTGAMNQSLGLGGPGYSGTSSVGAALSSGGLGFSGADTSGWDSLGASVGLGGGSGGSSSGYSGSSQFGGAYSSSYGSGKGTSGYSGSSRFGGAYSSNYGSDRGGSDRGSGGSSRDGSSSSSSSSSGGGNFGGDRGPSGGYGDRA
jgi:hypothetical protein